MQALARGIGRFGLAFVLFYWICFTFPFPLELVGLPFQLVKTESQPAWMKTAGEKYGEAYSWIGDKQNAACTWVGDRVLHVEVIVQPTGSGDTMRGYVGCFCAMVIAAGFALLWTALVPLMLKWKPLWRPDAVFYALVRTLVSFFLCEMLLGYGFAKAFPLQFPAPSSFRLSQTLGEMSPMGLLWTFMGYSAIYQMFTGAVEVLAGVLLTTRRTTLLGALITLVSMTHIFALNMCFDVPVKLYSFHYLLMSMFLVAPELPRIIRVLVLGQSVEAKPFRPLLSRIKLDRAALVLRTLLVIAMVYDQAHGSFERWNETYGGPPAPVLGRWDVVSMQVDQKKPGSDDPLNWTWLDFSNRKILRLAGPKPPNTIYLLNWDPTERKLTLTNFRKPEWSAIFKYELPQAGELKLQGSMDGKAINASLKLAPDKKHELTNRGFHWIQEVPYNR